MDLDNQFQGGSSLVFTCTKYGKQAFHEDCSRL